MIERIGSESVEVLNVDGSRRSEDGDIYAAVSAVLDAAFLDSLSLRDS